MKLHPRNKHNGRYDLEALIKSCPALKSFIQQTPKGTDSINFFDPAAVKCLNKALLVHHYDIEYWDIPAHYLCPPIPGRADYIHYIADLLAASNRGKIPKGNTIKCLDIGVGANCVYPIIAHQTYGWSFIGTDIDSVAIESAQKIVAANPDLKGNIELKLQTNPKAIFKNIIAKDTFVDVVICNPPFHDSPQAAQAASKRKVSNLKRKTIKKPVLNFGGQSTELWCEGGEVQFIQNMIAESRMYRKNCFWFSTLVSKQANLPTIYKSLKNIEARNIKTIDMAQGNKISRFVAWSFLNPKQQEKWYK